MTGKLPPEIIIRLPKVCPEAVENPNEMIYAFCDAFDLNGCRERLWGALKGLFSSEEVQDWNAIDRGNYFFFFERLEALLEASYLLYEPMRKKRVKEILEENRKYGLSWDKYLEMEEQEEEEREKEKKEEGRWEQADERLEQIIRQIGKTVDAEKIFRLNEDADGTTAGMPYDFLVLIANGAHQPLQEYKECIEADCAPIAPVSVIVHKANEIYPLLERGHIFFSTVCTKKNLVFEDGRHELPAPMRMPVEEITAKARVNFQHGFSKAKIFLEGAHYYQVKKENEMAGFMLQQAAEHTYRSLIRALTGYKLVTHSLSRLMHFCTRFARELSNFFPRTTEEENRIFSLLQKAYVNARYKDDFEVEENDLSLLSERVTALQQYAQELFEEKIAAFEKTWTIFGTVDGIKKSGVF